MTRGGYYKELMSIDFQHSNRWLAYCRFKVIDPDTASKVLPEYAKWIADREKQYRDEKDMTFAEFYKEEKATRKNAYTNFEAWLNGYVDK